MQATAYFDPVYNLIASSNLLTYSPADDIHPVSKQSFTYFNSFPLIFGTERGIIFFLLFYQDYQQLLNYQKHHL